MHAATLVSGGWATRSKAGYATAVRRYLGCARTYGFLPLPLTDQKILRFIAFMDIESLAPRTVKCYSAGLRAWVISLGYPEPVIWTPPVNLAIRAMARSAPDPILPLPITFRLLATLVAALSPRSHDLLLAAAMCLQYFGCLRASELCADPENGVIPLRAHVTFLVADSRRVMAYTALTSKTNPRGFTVYLGCSQNRDACAPCLMAAYFAKDPRPVSSPLFPLASGRPLTYPAYNAALKALIQRVGLDPNRYSTHSFRAGSATQAAQSGLSAQDIQRLGRWRSQAFQAYMRPEPVSFARFAPVLAPAHCTK